MVSRYTFEPYSPAWPAMFEKEAARLRRLVGDAVLTVHHVGSTAVPGLAAKPIIDLMPIVREIATIDACTPRLEEAGYRAWGAYGLPGRRYFTRDHAGHRTHNVHVFEVGNPEVERHLAFRAYLCAHEHARREYEACKRAAFAEHPADIMAYNDAKAPWIQATERLALAWYRQRSG